MGQKTFNSTSPRLHLKRIAGYLRITGLFVASLALFLAVKIHIPVALIPGIFFLGLVLITTIFEFYWLLAPRIERLSSIRRNANDGGDEGSLYTPSNYIFDNRHPIRLILQSMVVVFSWVLTITTAWADHLYGDVIAGLFFLYSMLTLAWVEYEAARFRGTIRNYMFWGGISVVAGVIIGFASFGIGHDPDIFWLTGLNGFLIALVIFFVQRIGVGEEVWAEVIGDLNTRLLNFSNIGGHWSYIVSSIGERLRYQRVFILQPDLDEAQLKIVAEYGDYHHVIGKSLSINNGITGHVYNTGQALASNDVDNCKYYQRLIDQEVDNTRSEIAVPIRYRGEIFGVLDVQSDRLMIYGPADLRSLEVIGQILGIAMAMQRSDLLLKQATNLWEKLSREIHSEADLFDALANFAMQELDADLVNYYHLSPAGFPIQKPRVVGRLLEPDRLSEPVIDLHSPLIRLIKDWQPHFASKVEVSSILYHKSSSRPPSFVEREKIKSVCFVPIGTPDEKLGVVFLNYRHHKSFDSLYQLMVLGFAQAFATFAARERYRYLTFEGLGRPELGLHNIQARYGLKDGVMQEGRRIFNEICAVDRITTFTKCGMFELLNDLDNFLIEVKAQSSIDHFPWRITLREAIGDFTRRMKEQIPSGQSLHISTELDLLIEREPAWTRLALYRVATEAINNAVFHGRANEIEIEMKRLKNIITMKVTNNNEPLPEDAARHRSRGGIFSLLEEMEKQFGAQTSIRRRSDGKGTIVVAEIPAIPLEIEAGQL